MANKNPSTALSEAEFSNIKDWTIFCGKIIRNEDGSENTLIVSPDWNEAGKYYHDFRTHVPQILRMSWNILDIETKVAIFIIAQKLADNEEYD